MILENQRNRYFHVTPKSNLSSILENGLIAQVGERSRDAGESRASVFLFPTAEDIENAMFNWLGDELNGKECAILQLDLPESSPVLIAERNGSGMFEAVSYENIPAGCITGVFEDI